MKEQKNKDLLTTILAEKRTHRKHILFLVSLLCASIIVSLAFGSVSIDLHDIWRILLFKTTTIKYGDWNYTTEQIVWMIRTPRILFTVLVGGGLAITGAVTISPVRLNSGSATTSRADTRGTTLRNWLT